MAAGLAMALAMAIAGCGNQGSSASTGTAGGGSNNVPTVGTGGAQGGGANPSGTPTRPAGPTPSAAPSSAATQTFNVTMTADNHFQPPSIDIPRGATVVWTNSGSAVHTVTDDPARAQKSDDAALPSGAQSFDSGNLAAGTTYSHIFDTPGQYRYFCSVHEADGMVARINVSS